MGGDNDLNTDTVAPPAFLVDSDGNELETVSSGKSYKYRDFSNVDENDEDAMGNEGSVPPLSRNSVETSIRVQKFPVKLYAILAQKEFNEIITWMPHGRSWKVLKPNIFESMVMPLFFEYSNYHSFNRLVNAWSFRRVSSGPDRGSYYHELFLRGKPHLQKYMRRLPKTHKKLPMKKQDEPDFYRMDQTNSLPALEETSFPGAMYAPNMMNNISEKRSEPLSCLQQSSLHQESSVMNSVDPTMSRPVNMLVPSTQGQRFGNSSMYGSGAGHDNLILDDFGDIFSQQEQPVPMASHQNFTREVIPNPSLSQDQYGSAAQMSRTMLQASAGALRAGMGVTGSQQRLRQSMMDNGLMPGLGMGSSDLGNSFGSQPQQQMDSFLNGSAQLQMEAMNHRMNKMGAMNASATMNRMNQMNAQMGMSNAMQGLPQMSAQQGFNDMQSQQQLQQAQQRQRQMNMYQDNISSMGMISGSMGVNTLDDFGAISGLNSMKNIPLSFQGNGQ